MKPEIQAAFDRVLPQRAEAVVVSDLGRAFQLARSSPETTFITLEGEALTPRGLLSASAAPSKKLGLLSLKRRKSELEKKILHIQKSLAGVEKTQERQQQELETAQRLFARSQESCYQVEKEIIALVHQQEQWESEQAHQSQALEVIEEEKNRFDQEYHQQKAKVREIEKELTQKSASQTKVEGMLSEKQKSLQQLKAEFGRAQEQLHLISSDRKIIQERCLALERASKRVKEQHRGLEARRAANQLMRSQNEGRLQNMRTELQTLKSNLGKYRKQADQIAIDLQTQKDEQADWKEAHPVIENRLAQLRDQKTELQENGGSWKLSGPVSKRSFKASSSNVWSNCNFRLRRWPQGMDLPAAPMEEILESCNQLKARLDEFGPINMTALEEYQENEERYNFLMGQRQDIEQSIADTTRAIQEINRRSREKFGEAFEAVNAHFGEIFRKLFGGGECGIQLLDEEDLLESGIDIYAQPPGKKLQNVSLLSGGEKAMTVLALLMAFFTYRPSQFCVLDEVDAPLDDANVRRFTALIQEMSQETQIIIITHNKRTIEAAEALYGVTMEEAGVSQVVSGAVLKKYNRDDSRIQHGLIKWNGGFQ